MQEEKRRKKIILDGHVSNLTTNKEGAGLKNKTKERRKMILVTL